MQVAKTFLFLIYTALFHSAVFASGAGKIVLVLDDIGNQLSSGRASIDIPWITTVAIMPQRPHSVKLAEYAHSLNKEIIVHAPMSNEINFPLGPLGLEKKLGKDAFLKTAQEALRSVPYAVGLSNHMGSKLTQDHQAMSWLMSVLKSRQFYFLDSRTIASTIAWEVAEEYQVPWAMRNVFLDHVRNHDFMASQWQIAVKKAEAGEVAIVICHPYAETIDFLSTLELPERHQSYLVPLSHVLHYPAFVDQKKIRNLPQGT